MATGATGQLGLALPVQGELSGTWGDTVNNGITQYTNIAIAGTLTLTNDGAVTLANTTGDASASNITSTLTGAGTVTAQFAIVRVTGTLTTAKVVTAPSYSKTYTVVNAATGGIVTFKASGQTGVSVAVGETAFVYFNGTDYVKVAGTAAVSSFSAGTTGLTPNTATTGAVTLAGTLATTNGGTGLTSFTANGVVYASSSSALATGSALTFDGTNVFKVLAATGIAYNRAESTQHSTFVQHFATSGGTGLEYKTLYRFVDTDVGELMRLTSTGLGIGTSSPTTKLYVTDSAASTAVAAFFNTDTSNGNGVFIRAGGANSGKYALAIENAASSSLLLLDSTGNLGLGVTPSAWGGSFKAFQIASGGTSLWSDGSVAFYNRNTFYDGTNRKYVVNGFAQEYAQLNDGSHAWKITTSGSANGNITFTQAMTLDASGNLGIGETSPSSRLHVAISSGPYVARFQNTSTATDQYNSILIYQGASGSATGYIGTGGSTVGNTAFANNFVVGTQTNSPLVFTTNDTERARIDTSGNFGISNGMLFVSRPTGNTQFTSGIGINASNTTGEGIEFLTTASTGTRLLSYDRNVAAFRRLDLAGNEIHLSPNNSTSVIVNGFGLGVGASTPSSGTGITFPATQSASSNANTLDDYEEGTWTPSLGGNTTYSGQQGFYTKIGNVVTIWMNVAVSTLGTGSTTNVTGLPFAMGTMGSYAGSTGYFASLAISVVHISPIVHGSTQLKFMTLTSAGSTVTDGGAIFGNSAQILCSVTYQT
jgi:hypothetical protein